MGFYSLKCTEMIPPYAKLFGDTKTGSVQMWHLLLKLW